MHLMCLRKGRLVMLDLVLLRQPSNRAPFEGVDPLAFAQAHVVELAGNLKHKMQVLRLHPAGVKSVFEGLHHANKCILSAYHLAKALFLSSIA